jgi:hypothetical protein
LLNPLNEVVVLLRSFLHHNQKRSQDGINMVDLMMWLVIAAMLLAAAIQGIGYYQKAALGYQAKSDLDGLKTWVAAKTSMTSENLTLADLQAALDDGDLKMTKNAGMANTPILAVSGSSYCIGVRAESLTGNNVYYSSSKDPSIIKNEASFPADCGIPAETIVVRSDAEITVNFATLSWAKKSSLAGVQWLGLDASSNGQYVIGGQNNGDVFTSTDGGGSWKKHDLGKGQWWGVTISSDGRKLMAASLTGVHLSDNGGDTWTKANLPAGDWTRVASSNDGTRLAVSDYSANGSVYTSNDSGTTWVKRISSSGFRWQSMESSADGRVIFSGTNGGAMYVSKDYGSTWSVVTSLGNGDWHDLDVSSDGSRVITGEASGNLLTSNDTGATWKRETANGVLGWRGVTTSDDGKVMAAGQRSGYVYTSIDSGQTWVQRTDSGTGIWYAVASTSDGSKIIVGQYGTAGNLYIGTYNKNG